ncbi:MAG TPA: mandelate racemase/muconate lactonizing enzyme family protein [Candidatus Dormibacteraeota bacterium]|jgi:galactonate dehydratase|nr:mandelate racemase/muconate lactonizing enzyme family protein [Candidatus Dormibacteraeota bacterium]
MKITDVKSFPVMVGSRNCFIVKVETDEGLSGLGEGGMSGRELAMEGMVSHYARSIQGMDPLRIEHIWQRLYRGWYFEGGKISGAVVAAIDMALWDILGKHLGVPVYQLLGGACRDRVETFYSCGSPDGDGAVETATRAAARGWKVLRFGPAQGRGGGDPLRFEPLETLAVTAAALRRVQDAVGPEVQISIDYHHRLSVAEAALFSRHLDLNGVRLMFLEEPIRAESPDAYRQLRTMTTVPFAIGEEFSSKWDFAPFIEQGLLNFARLDVSNVGGLTESRKVANWCETHYVDVMPHNPLGPVTTAATIHLAAAINNFAQLEFQEQLAASYPTDLFPTMPRIEGSAFPLPAAPGLGVTFDEEAAAAHPFEYWEPPQLHRDDGAHTNW